MSAYKTNTKCGWRKLQGLGHHMPFPQYPQYPLPTHSIRDTLLIPFHSEIAGSLSCLLFEDMPHSDLKRMRTRVACYPCRERKRKCDGAEPCETCSQWGYDCHYKRQSRQRNHPPQQPQREIGPDPRPPQQTDSVDTHGLDRRLWANSGAAFVRRMGLNIDPAKAPKLSLFGWNIGKRQLSSESQAVYPVLSITDITSLEHMRTLAQVYFTKIAPYYGFIDSSQFFERLEARWQSPMISSLYDSVLGGVAALGCLHSQRNMTITELHLIASAQSILDSHVLCGAPPVDLLVGWTLRVVYMRMTDLPHSTWMASSKLMHLVEAAGFHLESTDSVFPRSIDTEFDPDIQRRLFGVALHLNMWTSYDLGLSRVSFRKNDLPLLPSTIEGDYTHELLGLIPLSASLDPGKPKEDDIKLEETLVQILERVHNEPPSAMAQCNLVLCILRRIHTEKLEISPLLAEKALAVLEKGLSCSRTMVANCTPWQHMANVPFHIICLLLVMDTRQSLALLPEAMQTLKFVASTYDTNTLREAWSAALLLVMLHQQRRKDDIAIFNDIMNMEEQERPAGLSPQEFPSAEEYSWLGALVADLPGLQRDDLDQFLNSDMIDSSSFLGGAR
ncbi:transcriptional regulator family: Fungal Specific TF [Penicillium roqueforti]|nr:transcriptional regulator family: Fungal Specific TF [Penicillium roqueforti]KAI2689172.1 transcriptional regulator family: Fungal Specific TF [Penicillium roqueforti]KAI2703773.1 transcriptional regulator family: Fungal Specific TF [Penicillium roqueforti]KAI2716589.1 transcriptional regulator family: Fungal Specific TF [Penicillium roqueforti]KAI2760620.1 transcriptional regulator family: Fungal Specific TF [Penicillium roqueforti]